MKLRSGIGRVLSGIAFAASALAMSAALAAVQPTAGDVPERRVALVVGNADYPEQPLKNPVSDARAMQATLTSLGFEVMLVENATRRAMEDAILRFGVSLADGGVGLFYYAGHGLQVRGTNYLIPIDENITTEASVRFEAVSLDAVLEEMSQPRPDRANFIILDACRDNPYASRYGGSGAGLALVDAPTDFLVAYATAPGAVAYDADSEDGKNGLYTGELLKAMQVAEISVEDMFKRVRAAVSEKTRHAQVPWEASSLVRDFSFSPAAARAEPAPAVELRPPSVADARGLRSNRMSQEAELFFWDAIRNSDIAADYEAYLESFPDGVFSPLARARVIQLRQQQARPPVEPSGPQVEEIEAYFTVLANSNLREEPTAQSRRVGRVTAGSKVLATGKVEGANWYRVETEGGEAGFLFGGLVIPFAAPAPAPPAAQPRIVAEAAPTAQPPAEHKVVTPPTQQQPAAKSSEVSEPASEPQPEKEIQAAAVQAPPPKPQPQKTVQPAALRPPPKAAFETFKDCDACPEMVRLPVGEFVMGASRGDPSERPAHDVTIKRPFALGVNEVTYGEWKNCVNDGGCDHLPKLKGASDRAPVRNISWSDAQQYVAWLAKTTGRSYRLPTEAEWEYAARANTESVYWWGDDAGVGNANCKDCGGEYDRKAPAEVGSYRPNPFGLYEMSGGVWEWVSDCWNDSYDGAPGDGSARDQSDCRQRVLRGGSWRNDASYLRTTARFYYDAVVRFVVNGFRVALTLD
jgi:formylglycine-generating enzyme required for sulfatase activity/uncharacterized caspase-like protein